MYVLLVSLVPSFLCSSHPDVVLTASVLFRPRSVPVAFLQAAKRDLLVQSKHLTQTFRSLPSIRKTIDKASTLRSQIIAQRAEAKEKRRAAGLAGVKVGKNVVGPGGEVDVQLGEELSDSFRGLKVRRNFSLGPLREARRVC
jgi:hypothetical protein